MEQIHTTTEKTHVLLDCSFSMIRIKVMGENKGGGWGRVKEDRGGLKGNLNKILCTFSVSHKGH